MVQQSNIVIIGAGQAGLQAAASLRELHHDGRIVLVGDEAHAPYQRPPLSKAYLFDEAGSADVTIRPDTFFAHHRIELCTGRRAVAIDRARRRVAFADHGELEYDQLVLATGARNRRLCVPGADLGNVFYLRTLDEAKALRARMAASRSLVVIGAGFIGLELAAGAAAQGLETTVLDVVDRPMARALSKTMSAVFSREHRTAGVRLQFETQVRQLRGEHGCVTGVETHDGQILPADLVVIGIGVTPNLELAAACGLAIDNGIVVDECLQTSDPHVSAIGDVAAHPNPYAHGQRVRLESVQNAVDQARCVAQRLVGRPTSYEAVPWFWSYQGALKLQMTGLPRTGCEEVVRGDANGTACSVFSFREGNLVCVETLNRPADHMLARRLLATRVAVTALQVADLGFDLKSLLPKPGAGAAAAAR